MDIKGFFSAIACVVSISANASPIDPISFYGLKPGTLIKDQEMLNSLISEASKALGGASVEVMNSDSQFNSTPHIEQKFFLVGKKGKITVNTVKSENITKGLYAIISVEYQSADEKETKDYINRVKSEIFNQFGTPQNPDFWRWAYDDGGNTLPAEKSKSCWSNYNYGTRPSPYSTPGEACKYVATFKKLNSGVAYNYSLYSISIKYIPLLNALNEELASGS